MSLVIWRTDQMVVRENPGFWRLFFVMQGSILPQTLPKIIVIAALGCVVSILHVYMPTYFYTSSVSAFALLGVSLSLFLGFRNHASYERWVEGRKLWGALMFSSRNLNREMYTLFHDDGPISIACRDRVANLNVAFIRAVHDKLRPGEVSSWQSSYLLESDMAFLDRHTNTAMAILLLIGHEIGEWRSKGYLDSVNLRDLNLSLNELSAAYCSCERIFSTPIPFAYMLLMHRTAYLYCVLLPWGIVASVGLVTPVISALIAYTFFGFDALSEELAAPFGTKANCLPISTMTLQIENEIMASVGRAPHLQISETHEDHIIR